MTHDDTPGRDWPDAELADTIDEVYELELEDATLSREIARIYKAIHPDTIDRASYFRALLQPQAELIKLQDWVQHKGEKIVAIFEGRESANKIFFINQIKRQLDPRVARVVALPSPSGREKTQWHFRHYLSQLPAGGEIVLFDRSWYNHAGIERVMGLAA